MSGMIDVLTNRRGFILSEKQGPGIKMVTVKAYLPVAESFGFNKALQEAT